MSFMPNVGTVVEMKDGRVAAVSSFTPLGDDDRVIFPDGHQEFTDAWQIHRLLTDEDAAGADNPDPLSALQRYLASSPEVFPA